VKIINKTASDINFYYHVFNTEVSFAIPADGAACYASYPDESKSGIYIDGNRLEHMYINGR
jgi:hypothetical protein